MQILLQKVELQSNLSISNLVNSKSPLFRRKIECPWIYPSPLRFPGYFEAPLFRTFFHFPWDFEIAGSTVLSTFRHNFSQPATTSFVATQVLTWVEKHATSLLNSFCRKVAKQGARFCGPFTLIFNVQGEICITSNTSNYSWDLRKWIRHTLGTFISQKASDYWSWDDCAWRNSFKTVFMSLYFFPPIS